MNSRAMENLANAIILSAVNDYRKALAGERVAGKESKWVIAECERFFVSDWFGILTNVDGEMIMKSIKREITQKG